MKILLSLIILDAVAVLGTGCAGTSQQKAINGASTVLKDATVVLQDVQTLTPIVSAVAAQVSGTNNAKVQGYISAVNADVAQAAQDANALSAVIAAIPPVTTGTVNLTPGATVKGNPAGK